MASIPTLRALLIDEIKDLYYAENQLIKALPIMAKASGHPALAKAFSDHLVETREHKARLAQALTILGSPVKGKKCHAMTGLLLEGDEAMELKGPASVRDAAILAAGQRIEHYEMAGYGSARSFAEILGENEVTHLLQATLDEEGQANKNLIAIAATAVNEDARAGRD